MERKVSIKLTKQIVNCHNRTIADPFIILIIYVPFVLLRAPRLPGAWAASHRTKIKRLLAAKKTKIERLLAAKKPKSNVNRMPFKRRAISHIAVFCSLCSRAILENTSTTSGLAHEKLGGSGEGDPTVPGPSDGLRLVRSRDLNQSSASFGSGFKLSFPHRGSLARGCGGWETRSRFLL